VPTTYAGRAKLIRRLGELHGAAGSTVYRDGAAVIEHGGERWTVRPPFGLDHEGAYARVEARPLVEALAADHLVAALLVRLGGYAVGVLDGERIEVSKVGSRLVHGRHRAGGSSANRFRRRREKEVRELHEEAAREAWRVLGPWLGRVERSVLGGDRSAVQGTLQADPRLAPLEAMALPRFLTVPDPRRAVLESVPFDLYAAELTIEPLAAG
jgi:Actinobacteria/chloroflexi VLRF1 release factor